MKHILSLCFVLIVGVISAQQWNTIKVFSPSQTIKDVLFVDETTAYAVSALYNQTGLNVKKTTDGGVSWEEQFTGHYSNSFRTIATPNAGEDVFVVGNEGVLIHTNNGGEEWNTIDVGLELPLRDLFFLSETIGYLTSDNAIMLKTIDGGMTWNEMDMNLAGVSTISNVYFLTEERGFVAGFNYFKETFDGGDNWSDVDGFAPMGGVIYQIQEIEFLDDEVGYISGDVGLLYRTEDGGDTWTDLTITIPDYITESLFGIRFLDSDPNLGFACGYHGLLIRTFDGGLTWELMDSDVVGTNDPDGPIFHSMDFYNNKGFVTGHNGQILEFEAPVANRVTVMDNTIEISPNPVSDFLHFDSKQYQVLEVSVMDIKGNLLIVQSGLIEDGINCTSLSSGSYILQLRTNEGIYSASFVKL